MSRRTTTTNRKFTSLDGEVLFRELEEFRKALSKAQQKAPFRSEIYKAIDEAFAATGALAKVLTGDPDVFVEPLHTSPPRQVAPKTITFREWKTEPLWKKQT